MKRTLIAIAAFFLVIFGIFAATTGTPPATTPSATAVTAAAPAATPPAATPPAATSPAATSPAAAPPAAAPPAAAPAAKKSSKVLTCVDPAKAIASGKDVSWILGALIDPSCGMTLQGAVDAIVAAGGDKQTTQDAALLINPDFLPGPAAGPGDPAGPKTSISNTIGGGGGASPL